MGSVCSIRSSLFVRQIFALTFASGYMAQHRNQNGVFIPDDTSLFYSLVQQKSGIHSPAILKFWYSWKIFQALSFNTKNSIFWKCAENSKVQHLIGYNTSSRGHFLRAHQTKNFKMEERHLYTGLLTCMRHGQKWWDLPKNIYLIGGIFSNNG